MQVRAVKEEGARREAELLRQLQDARAAAASDGVASLQDLLAAREAELSNLQSALGEMAFEVEAAEKLRGELRRAKEGAEAAAREREAAQGQLDGEGRGGSFLSVDVMSACGSGALQVPSVMTVLVLVPAYLFSWAAVQAVRASKVWRAAAAHGQLPSA
jgi:hypothetical protein